MANPSKDLLEAEGTLRLLVDHLHDEQKALQGIAEDLKDDTLKRMLLAESLKRAEFRGEIENILHQEGVRDVVESGTAAGKFVRAWTQLKASLGGGDAGLVATAAEGEKSVLDAYSDALDKDLPMPVREVLAAHAVKIRAAYDVLCVARDRAA